KNSSEEKRSLIARVPSVGTNDGLHRPGPASNDLLCRLRRGVVCPAAAAAFHRLLALELEFIQFGFLVRGKKWRDLLIKSIEGLAGFQRGIVADHAELRAHLLHAR